MTLIKKTEKKIRGGQTCATFIYKLKKGTNTEHKWVWYLAQAEVGAYSVYNLKIRKGKISDAMYAKVVAFSK